MLNFFPFDPRPGAINEFPPNAKRVVDAYCEVHQNTWADNKRVLAMPRALGAPYGATPQRQRAKRERIHARLRIARKGH